MSNKDLTDEEKEILMNNVKLIRKQCAGLPMKARQNAVRDAIYHNSNLADYNLKANTTAKKKRPSLKVHYKLNGIPVCKGMFGFAYIVGMFN